LLIATAIFKQPKLLIIDNPYIGLDEKNRNIFNQLIDELATEQNITIILSGHFHSLPTCITHELHLDREGNAISREVSSTNLAANQQTFSGHLKTVQDYFKDCSHHPEFINAVKLKNVSIKYEDTSILDTINWSVKNGEKWSLFGPNGSGKSTMLGLIAADHPKVYANEVYLFDKQRGRQDSIWDIKKNIGFISSEMHTYFTYDVNKTIEAIIFDGLFTSIYSRPPITDSQQSCLNALLDYFDINHLKQREFATLSTGEQRLVLILRALIKNPPLLLLDEPFQGLDDLTINRFKYLLNEVLTDRHAMIFITHYEHEVPTCVEQTFYLEEGKRV